MIDATQAPDLLTNRLRAGPLEGPGEGRSGTLDLPRNGEPTTKNRKTPGPATFRAARLYLWASSPPSYLSALPAHPVELRARRGRCRCALGPKRTRSPRTTLPTRASPAGDGDDPGSCRR